MGQGWAVLDIGAGAAGSRPVSFASSRTTVERSGDTVTFREQLAVASTDGAGTTRNVHTTATTTMDLAPPPAAAVPQAPPAAPAVPASPTVTPAIPVSTTPVPTAPVTPASPPAIEAAPRRHRSRDQLDSLAELRDVVARMIRELQQLQRDFQRTGGWMSGRHIGGGLDVHTGRGGRVMPSPLPPTAGSPAPAVHPVPATTPAPTPTAEQVPSSTPAPAPEASTPPAHEPQPCAPAYTWYHIRDATLSRFNGEMLGFEGDEATQVAQAVDGAKLNDGMHRLYGLLGQVAEYQLSGHDLSADQLHAIADEADAIFAEAVRTPTSEQDAGDYAPSTRDGVFDPDSAMRSTRSLVVEATVTAAAEAPAAA